MAVCPDAFRTDFRDKSSMKNPAHPMQEYNGTAAHDVVAYLRDHNHIQQGDPKKAAEFVLGIATGDKMPRILTIGKDCCDAAAESLRQTLRNTTHGNAAKPIE